MKKKFGMNLEALIKLVAQDMAEHDVEELGDPRLEDVEFEALERLHDRIHNMAMGTGRCQDWLNTQFGEGTWDDFVTVNSLLLCAERGARNPPTFSSLPMQLKKIARESEWKHYVPLAKVAVKSVLAFYGDKQLSAVPKQDNALAGLPPK